MTAPQYGATATPVINNTAGASCVFNTGLPTRNENDILCVSLSRAAVTAAFDNIPTGFRLARNIAHDGGDIAFLVKLITAGEPSTYTFDWTGNSRNVGNMFTVLGPDPTNVLAAEPAGATGTGTTPDSPASGTVALGDYLAIAVGGQEGKGATRITAGTPTNYTVREDDGNTGSGGPTGHDSSFVSTRELTAITTEDPGAFTSAVDDGWGTLTFLVAEPAVAVSLPGRRRGILL